ncbi:hypothetical protein PLESTF_001142000 [Pleodorina starrii]|nr:hypothetical protein PLESTF_001142000 [Pleodorina starrii]
MKLVAGQPATAIRHIPRQSSIIATPFRPSSCTTTSQTPCAPQLARNIWPSTVRASQTMTTAQAATTSLSSLDSPGNAASNAEQLRQARVVVMSTPACPYCKRAKEALASAGIPYVDVNVGIDEALRQKVRDVTGKRTVPQIFLAGRSIGGCDDLLTQLADGGFRTALAEAEAAAATAVQPDLLAEIESAQRRAAEASAQHAQAGPDGGGATAAAAAAAAAGRQQLEALAARLRLPEQQGGIARSERTSGSRAFRVFSLRRLLDWLSAAGETTDPRVTATRLLAANVIAAATLERQEADRVAAAVTRGSVAGGAADDDALLMLSTEAPAPKPGEALNVQFMWQGPARPANEVAGSLRQLILELYDTHLSADGRSVSYGAMRSDPRFAAFVIATAELQVVDLSPLSREELMAFAINLYNALIIHALVALGLTRMTSTQRATFYSRTAKYNIGGLDYSADDLENGVLRGNRAGASNLFNLLGLTGLAGGCWRRGDPRLAKVVSPPDARIHFALVCGAKSCPPIKLYTAANLEEGLAAAAEAFCGEEVRVDAARREVKLSKIFKWYAVDFGKDKYERLSYIATFLTEPARGELQQLVRAARSGSGDVRVTYSEYDWSLNGTD